MTRAVFLDRDGVLNDAIMRNGRPHPPFSVSELRVSAGARDALLALKDCGFSLYVVSNQPDVARGVQKEGAVRAINAALQDVLPVDDFYVCFHDDRDECRCRKPLPGMLKQASIDHGVVLAENYLVGDRWRDIDAGASVGGTTILIDRGYDERRPQRPPDRVVASITEAAQAIIEFEKKRSNTESREGL